MSDDGAQIFYLKSLTIWIGMGEGDGLPLFPAPMPGIVQIYKSSIHVCISICKTSYHVCCTLL